MISIHEAANHFIARGIGDSENGGEYVTHLKLQKLLYFAQAWHLGITGERLFPEEFQAWVHGPVNVDVYHMNKHRGWTPVFRTYGFPTQDPEASEFLDQIWAEYGVFSGKALEQMTHSDPPWVEARKGLGPLENSQAVISVDLMKDIYARRASEDDGSEG